MAPLPSGQISWALSGRDGELYTLAFGWHQHELGELLAGDTPLPRTALCRGPLHPHIKFPVRLLPCNSLDPEHQVEAF
jgi:hypothetical protein